MGHTGGSDKPKVAVIITEYRYNSHAEVIVGRLFGQLGFKPRIEVASLYLDQFPDNDMSREEAARAGIPICGTIKEAIVEANRHGQGLAGVLIIGEHGQYPMVPNGQKDYPRRRFVEETLNALDEIGVRVPIFSDKHLSWHMDDALWIYRSLKARGIPFLGGSSIPLVPFVPAVNEASLQKPQELLAVSFGGTEDYGYHAWEALQSLAERRSGGETGVTSIRVVQGEQVWEEMDRGEWPEQLMHLALATHPDRRVGHPRTRIIDPVLMTAKYADGLTGYVLQLPNEVQQWSVAWRTFASEEYAVRFESDLARPFNHFETLTARIEDMVLSGQSPVPIERTLLTTGMIHYSMESLHHNATIQTPALHIQY
jgi:hypothetical protein